MFFGSMASRPTAGSLASCGGGLPCVFGYTEDGRYLIVVYEELDVVTILPVTAYEVPEPN